MWKYTLIEEAKRDFKKLDGSQRKVALAMLNKLIENPLPNYEGGYGVPLGNHLDTGNLSGFLKLKSRGSGIRIVYELVKEDNLSQVIVIGMREEKEVYKIATKRIKNQKEK